MFYEIHILISAPIKYATLHFTLNIMVNSGGDCHTFSKSL